jgi:hypothetical protein
VCQESRAAAGAANVPANGFEAVCIDTADADPIFGEIVALWPSLSPDNRVGLLDHARILANTVSDPQTVSRLALTSHRTRFDFKCDSEAVPETTGLKSNDLSGIENTAPQLADER